jgi:DNA-binding response OmpR family regulator
MTTRILIADDEKYVRQLLELVLEGQGYDVLAARNGDHLVRMAQEYIPDLILVDLMMPGLDGYEAIRQLRNDTRTAHIPMIILTARSTPNDVVTGFETGADDYITKPFNIPELLARIKGQLRRANQQPVRNPLSGLPGNVLLAEELKYRLRRPEPFALLHVDLDNFKAFNDTYGFARGDRVIKLVADVVSEALQAHGTGTDFVGHIGGDDFAVLTSPQVVDPLCSYIIDVFDQRVRLLYDTEDLERGYLQGIDRHGIPRQFPIIAISIGGVTNRTTAFVDHEDMSRVAAEMKHFAKQRAGSSYAIDVRLSRDIVPPEDRRGKRVQAVLVISADEPLLSLLYNTLYENGYRVLEARGIPDAHAIMTHERQLAVIAADARLGEPLWEFADVVLSATPEIALLVLSTRPGDSELAALHGAQVTVQQPFHVQEFIDHIARFVRPGA